MCIGDDCQETLELVEAYVIGALDTSDLVKVKQHIESCGGCWECILEYNAVHDALMLSCKPCSPSAELRTLILKQLVTETPRHMIQ